ncbi:hypothetical protein [Mycolicibacterium peregrinum]|uniref:Uncharacterized protein n=1 Tax=Mycolicibacterium peregrinum TaxID=43304 RepID=A0A4Z0HP05_MYCPR|nr:hypothetical protein [Mycolicibacterium peregrinum]TGB37919.1 hypothetical protein EJD98_25560 [Mycolicibacterium peregrinum]TGB38062.1 hypothetical protein EJD94_25005 [Mycolicibacterium peregrinum]
MKCAASPKCQNAAQPGRNRGLCHKHYDLDPQRGYVDPAAARERIALLRQRGVTLAMLETHGLSRYGVRNVQTAERIRRITAMKVMSVPVPADLIPTCADVDATGTARRIQALVAMGWPQSLIAAELGTAQTAVAAMALRKKVTAERAIAVRELFGRWAMSPGPSQVSRTRARSKGWVTILGWNDIDDPDEKPNLGAEEKVSFPDKYQELRYHVGLPNDQIADEMGIELESLERQLQRYGLFKGRAA